MNIMAAALKKAGVVDDGDVRRAEKEKAEERAELEKNIRLYTKLLSAFPPRLEASMARWIEDSRRLVPVEILLHWRETMASRGADAVWGEWSKWRRAWRKVQAGKSAEESSALDN